MIRNIRHIQIKKVAYHPNLFKAVITFEKPTIDYDESDDIEYIKLRDLEKQKKLQGNGQDRRYMMKLTFILQKEEAVVYLHQKSKRE